MYSKVEPLYNQTGNKKGPSRAGDVSLLPQQLQIKTMRGPDDSIDLHEGGEAIFHARSKAATVLIVKHGYTQGKADLTVKSLKYEQALGIKYGLTLEDVKYLTNIHICTIIKLQKKGLTVEMLRNVSKMGMNLMNFIAKF